MKKHRIERPSHGIELSPHIAEEQLRWRNSPEIRAWTRQNGILTEAEHDRWLEGLRERTDVKMFGVECGSEPVGTCGLTSINRDHRTAEFSLFIDPECQGKGYGHEALWLLLDHAFGALNLYKIWCESFKGNPAIKMFEEFGFVKEGVMVDQYEKDGERISAIRMGLFREQWYVD